MLRLLLLALTFCLWTSSHADSSDPLRLQLQWVPQAQFAGYYVAADQGWYEEAGLAVEILPHGAAISASRILAERRADIASMYVTQALGLWEQGHEVINIAQLIHATSLVLVSLAERGIKTPEALDGQLLSRWPGFELQPEALIRSFGIEPIVIDQGSTMTGLLSGAVDVAVATEFNEMHQLYLSGVDAEELNVIRFSEHMPGFVEDGLYVHADVLAERRDALTRFVEVTLRGWRHAFAHPEMAVDAVMRRAEMASQSTNRAHQLRMLETLRTLYGDFEGELLAPNLNAMDYEATGHVMYQQGTLTRPAPPFSAFHEPLSQSNE